VNGKNERLPSFLAFHALASGCSLAARVIRAAKERYVLLVGMNFSAFQLARATPEGERLFDKVQEFSKEKGSQKGAPLSSPGCRVGRVPFCDPPGKQVARFRVMGNQETIYG
jgi:hypothetical protein